MIVELPEKFETAIRAEAAARGVSPIGYVCEILERELGASVGDRASGPPFETDRGLFAKYGTAPSAEEIDANRADMFHNFGKSL